MTRPPLTRNAERVLSLFSRGEAHDAEGFTAFFSERPVYQFGNFEPCRDHESIRTSARSFFSRIQAVYHDIKTIEDLGHLVLVEMDVHYWRLDGSHVFLPCADIFRVEDERFSELRIFMDVNPVVDPRGPVDPGISVFAVGEGVVPIRKQHWMRWFFSEHEEGLRRIAQGHSPRWSVAGPGWDIALPWDDAS